MTQPAAQAARAPAAPTPPLEVRTAGVLRRGAAALLDAMPLLALTGAIALAGALGDGAPEPVPYNLFDRFIDLVNQRPLLVIGPLAVFAAAEVLWHAVAVALSGSTPGKRVFGMRLVDGHGRRPGPLRATLHAALRVLSLATLGLGHLTALPDPTQRTLYDRAAGVFVVLDPRAPAREKVAGS